MRNNGRPFYRLVLGVAALVAAAASSASAVLTGGTLLSPDPHAADPGNGTPWNYSGQLGGVLGTAIAPHYFVSAAHIGIGVGMPFHYNGNFYTTLASYDIPNSDLRLWKVDGNLGSYVPLETSTNTSGKPLFIIGRGTDRGDEIRSVTGTLIGWKWGLDSGAQRWGTNTAGTTVYYTNSGWLLTAVFRNTGSDATVTGGDSGGGFFVNDNGTWKLAGVTYSVDNTATVDGQTAYGAIIGKTMYASSIAGNLAGINAIIGPDIATGTAAQISTPEPASLGVLSLSALGLIARRRR